MANVTIRQLAKKELTNTLTPQEGEVLYAGKNRTIWHQELSRLLEEENQRLAELHESMETDLKRYEGYQALDAGSSISSAAIKAYQDALRKSENLILKLQRRIVEIDRFDRIANEADPAIGFLKAAIKEHRRLSLSAGRETEDQDIALWSALEGAWRFS